MAKIRAEICSNIEKSKSSNKRPKFTTFTSPFKKKLLKLNKIARKNFSSTSFNFYIKHTQGFIFIRQNSADLRYQISKPKLMSMVHIDE